MTKCVTSLKINGNAVCADSTATPANPLDLIVDDFGGYSLADCSLTMELLKPHEFRFTLSRLSSVVTNASKSYSIVSKIIGKEVECQAEVTLDDGKTSTLSFSGTIVSTSMKGLDISCVAKSNDYILQGAPKSRCFIGMTLENIVKTVCSTFQENALDIKIHPCFNTVKFPYIVQHNESDYDFLVRLAKRFGAFFFFKDGKSKQTKIVFGKLTKSGQPRQIEFPYNVSYELQAGDPNLRLMVHDYETDKDLDTSLTGFENQSEKLFKMSKEASVPLKTSDSYKFFLDFPNSTPVAEADSTILNFLTNYHKAIIGSYSANMAYCKFESFLFDLDLGSFIKLDNNGTMAVTSQKLTWNSDGISLNEITAMILPASSMADNDIFAPYMDVNAYPQSNAQRAVVLNNVDPKKMGRVQVQFAWQAAPANEDEKKALPWIRIAQPYGGDKKGCYILPEIGEEVMVGFEHENMEKPFVIGTLFHDSDDAKKKQMPEETWCEVGGDKKVNEENEVKAFRTKKGHTIEFHDTKEGDGFIRIYGNEKKDQPNYDIILSTDKIQKPNGDQKEDYQTKCADESAEAGKDLKEKEDYKLGKLRIMVRSNGGDIMLDAGDGDIVMNAKNIRVHATGNTTSLVDGNHVVKVANGQFVDVKSNSLVVQEKQTIVVKGEDSEEYQEKVSFTTKKEVDVKAESEVDIAAKKGVKVKAESEVDIKVAKAVKFEAQSLASQTDQKTELKASDFAAEATQSAKVKANTGLELNGGSSADLKGTSVNVDGTTTAVKGNASLDLKTAKGSRSGLWNDQ